METRMKLIGIVFCVFFFLPGICAAAKPQTGGGKNSVSSPNTPSKKRLIDSIAHLSKELSSVVRSYSQCLKCEKQILQKLNSKELQSASLKKMNVSALEILNTALIKLKSEFSKCRQTCSTKQKIEALQIHLNNEKLRVVREKANVSKKLVLERTHRECSFKCSQTHIKSHTKAIPSDRKTLSSYYDSLKIESDRFDSCIQKCQAPRSNMERIKAAFAGINPQVRTVKSEQQVVGEVLQVLGRIVVKKATQASLEYLKDFLMTDLLKCEDKEEKKLPFRFTSLCEIVKKADLHTILTKPDSFMTAFIIDFFDAIQKWILEKVDPKYAKARNLIKDVFGELKKYQFTSLFAKMLDAWKSGGAKAMANVFRNHMESQLLQIAKQVDCPPNGANKSKILNYERSLWVVAQCVVDTQTEIKKIGTTKKTDFVSVLKACSIEEKIKSCGIDSSSSESVFIDISRLSSIMINLLQGALGPSPKAQDVAKPAVQLYFYVLKDITKKIYSSKKDVQSKLLGLFGGLEKALVGIVDKDWLEVTIGVSNGVESVLGLIINMLNENNKLNKKNMLNKNSTNDEIKKHKDAIKRLTKLTRLVAAIGQYAGTYKDAPSGESGEDKKKIEALQKSRQQIIENLIEASVSRSSRTKGLIFSIGGAFGFSPGIRLGPPSDNVLTASSTRLPVTFSSPVSLTLGIAFQWFAEENCGWHLQLNAFDLGQYVQFKENSLDVALPDVQQAVNFSIIFGRWFWNRQLPFIAGVHFGVSPFPSSEKRPIFYVGLMVGAYVPFFDF